MNVLLICVIVVLVIFLILMALYLAVGNFFYNFALNAKRKKVIPNAAPPNEELDEKTKARRSADMLFKDSTSREDVYLASGKMKLHAYKYINTLPSRNWAIVVHGYISHADELTYHVRNFFEQGFNVLAPDLRGHGKSEGNYVGMGWDDRLDILLWIDLIVKEDPAAEIVLYGISMGAATVMMAVGENLPANVKAAVEDCGYTSIVDEFAVQLKNMFKLREFPVLRAADTMTRLRAGYSLYDGSAVRQLAKSKTPMLFIHGGKDGFVPFYMLDELYNAANVEKDKLVIEDANHFESALVDPIRYWGKVWEFCGKYVGNNG